MGWSKQDKGPMDMDNSVVIMAGVGGKRDIRGLNGNGKNTIKIILKKT